MRLVGERDRGQEGNSEAGPKAAALLDGRTKSDLVVVGQALPPEANSLSGEHRENPGGRFDEGLQMLKGLYVN